MATIDSSGMSRLDMNNPEDVQSLVDNGWAWKSGPKTMQRIIRLIVDGEVHRNPMKETPEVAAYLDKVAPFPPEVSQPVALDEAEPVEEPVEPTDEAPLA